MSKSKHSQLVVCSIMIAPARLLIFYKLRTWLDQIVRIVVHTYVADVDKVPLDTENLDGYWYCAGDFCDIDEAGASQHLAGANVEYAKCLVAPNIKDDDEDRPEKVIHGEYGIHYVCHNITNRVLYATKDMNTLVDLDVPITGYEIVVKSALGIYGQNKLEWQRRRQSCNDLCDSDFATPNHDTIFPERSRKEEIDRIHLRASGGNQSKAERLTLALYKIDQDYFLETNNFISEYDTGNIDFDNFNVNMINATSRLFKNTIITVGLKMAEKIYPDCDLEINEIDQTPKCKPELVQMG